MVIHTKKEEYICHSPPKGGGLLRISRAFSATLTGRLGIGTVRIVVGTERLILTQHSPYLLYETYHDVMVWGKL
jgi:hypothetical protein